MEDPADVEDPAAEAGTCAPDIEEPQGDPADVEIPGVTDPDDMGDPADPADRATGVEDPARCRGPGWPPTMPQRVSLSRMKYAVLADVEDPADSEDPADVEDAADCEAPAVAGATPTVEVGPVRHNGGGTLHSDAAGALHAQNTATQTSTLPATDTLSSTGSIDGDSVLAVSPLSLLLAMIAGLIAGAITWSRQSTKRG